MRRGELRRYVLPSTPDRPRTVLILSPESINRSDRSWVMGIELVGQDPGDLLAIPVAGHGWAHARNAKQLYRAWLADRAICQVDELTLTRVTGVVQIALGL